MDLPTTTPAKILTCDRRKYYEDKYYDIYRHVNWTVLLREQALTWTKLGNSVSPWLPLPRPWIKAFWTCQFNLPVPYKDGSCKLEMVQSACLSLAAFPAKHKPIELLAKLHTQWNLLLLRLGPTTLGSTHDPSCVALPLWGSSVTLGRRNFVARVNKEVEDLGDLPGRILCQDPSDTSTQDTCRLEELCNDLSFLALNFARFSVHGNLKDLEQIVAGMLMLISEVRSAGRTWEVKGELALQLDGMQACVRWNSPNLPSNSKAIQLSKFLPATRKYLLLIVPHLSCLLAVPSAWSSAFL